MNKTVFESHNVYKTRGTINENLGLIKSNTSLMGNYYINRGIKIFNRLPINLKFVDNDIKFKTMLKNYISNPFKILMYVCLYCYINYSCIIIKN